MWLSKNAISFINCHVHPIFIPSSSSSSSPPSSLLILSPDGGGTRNGQNNKLIKPQDNGGRSDGKMMVIKGDNMEREREDMMRYV